MTAVARLQRSDLVREFLPGLTAGSTYYRLFEAGLEMIRYLALRSVGHANEARSAGRE